MKSESSITRSGTTAEKLQLLMLKPEVQSWRALMGASQSIFRALERALVMEENCSISRFQILLILYFEGPLSASEIAKRLFVTRGNMSMFLKRLLLDGLVEASTRSKSKKRPLFCLTKKGQNFFEGLFPGHIGRVRKLMPSLPPEVLAILRQIANKP